MAGSTKKWVSTVKTVSTFPPEGLFNKDASTIAKQLASKKVSPKGPGSGMRMLTYYINRAGKGLSASRKAELEKAKKILSKRVQAAREKTHADSKYPKISTGPACKLFGRWRRRMSEHNGHLARGIVAGIVGGLVASWVMNEFMENLGPQLTKAVQGDEARIEPQAQEGEKPDDATMKTADAVVSAVTGGRHLSHEEKEKGGPIVHYAFGALMGAVYGAVAEELPLTTIGFGTGFGAALFTGADMIAVPALHLSGSSEDSPVSSLATPFVAHLVYGTTTETVRRVVRALLA